MKNTLFEFCEKLKNIPLEYPIEEQENVNNMGDLKNDFDDGDEDNNEYDVVWKDNRYNSFYIVGFSYCKEENIFEKLTVGTELQLVAEPKNEYDKYAVAIYFNEYKLGFVPQNQNKTISKFLNLGHTDIFEAKIEQLSKDAHPEQKVTVAVFIKDKNEK